MLENLLMTFIIPLGVVWAGRTFGKIFKMSKDPVLDPKNQNIWFGDYIKRDLQIWVWDLF